MNKRLYIKLRSFTLAELLVVMAISSMVVMLSYTTYLYVDKIIIDNFRSNEYYKTTLILHSLLKTDFEKSSLIIIKENKLELSLDNSKIVYTFEPPVVIRQNDTFEVQLADYQITELKKDEGMVKSLYLFAKPFKDSIEMLFVKDYSSDVLINAEIVKNKLNGY